MFKHVNQSIIREIWHKSNRELTSILFLSGIQIWLNFHFPALMRLGNPLHVILATCMSIFSTCAYIYYFAFPHKIAGLFNLEYLNDYPESLKYFLKNFQRVLLIIMGHVGMFLTWYYNIYSMPTLYYGIYYANFLTAAILFIRAARRAEIRDVQSF